MTSSVSSTLSRRSLPDHHQANDFPFYPSTFSGFLLAYLCFKEQKRIVKQNPALLICIMFVRRYFRLVLPLLVVVGFSMLMDLWTDSPNDVDSVFNVYTRSCPKYWWSIPTLTANFMGSNDMVGFGISALSCSRVSFSFLAKCASLISVTLSP